MGDVEDVAVLPVVLAAQTNAFLGSSWTEKLWGIRRVAGVLTEWGSTTQENHVHVLLIPQEYPANVGRKKKQQQHSKR